MPWHPEPVRLTRNMIEEICEGGADISKGRGQTLPLETVLSPCRVHTGMIRLIWRAERTQTWPRLPLVASVFCLQEQRPAFFVVVVLCVALAILEPTL